MKRRSFIRESAMLLGGLALHQNAYSAFPLQDPLIGESPEDDFWRQVRQAYGASPTLINLNNGGVSPSPRATLDALDHYNRMCNEAPSYYMWRILDQDREPLRQNLALLAGCDADELALNRNSTEALNTVIFGLPLQAGDEVVLSKYDYPNMINAWKQREKRDGIKLVWVDFEHPTEDADALTQAYVSKFTERTKLVHVTHIINLTGLIMPVRRIADQAHARNIEVLVDGAHSFALLDFKIPDLGGDYFGTSLHKWLSAPFGTGMLWIKKEKIGKIWPLLSSEHPQGDDIRKFETLGTRSFPIEMAIGYSLDLHNMIGSERKEKRLHFLKNYWMERVADVPGIHFYTSKLPQFGCAIGNFSLKGKQPVEIAELLFKDWKIHAVAIDWEPIHGVRVTPNVYSTTDELDRLAMAIRKIAKS